MRFVDVVKKMIINMAFDILSLIYLKYPSRESGSQLEMWVWSFSPGAINVKVTGM